MKYQDGIGSLYLSFMHAYGEYTIINNDTGNTYTAGKYLFIHEFIDLTTTIILLPATTETPLLFETNPATEAAEIAAPAEPVGTENAADGSVSTYTDGTMSDTTLGHNMIGALVAEVVLIILLLIVLLLKKRAK